GRVFLDHGQRLLDAFGIGRAPFDRHHFRPRLDRRERAGFHGEEHLERLGTELAANELRPAFGVGLLEWILVVHLGDVTGGAVEEDDDGVLAEVALDYLFEVVNVIGGDAAGAGGGVAGEVDDAAEELLFVVPGADDADLGVGRAGRLNN